VLELFRSLKKNRRLLRDFVVRDLKGRYVGSTMGFFWSLVFPLINLVVYTYVFRYVLKARWYDKQPEAEAVLLMLVGILAWHAFAEALARQTNTLVENSNLIQKIVFPCELMPVYLTISSLVNMAIGVPLALIAVAFAYSGPDFKSEDIVVGVEKLAHVVGHTRAVGLSYTLIALPLLFALQGVFMLGLGMILSTLNLFVRDIYHLVGVFTTVWMFATPIFYPDFRVQEAGVGWILAINPMAWLIACYRDVMCYGEWPDGRLLLRFAITSFVLLALGARFFLSQKRRFPDLL
jgi:homopolymeric O-antigen transport system permease protein